ncbi:MAG: nucleoside triphosphate pyrophosphohydrolase family protein [Candidatus Paceibacterota bacterium]
MKTRGEWTEDFHVAFGIAICEEPSVRLLKLRRTLIDEETKELFADIDMAITYLEREEDVPPELYANMLKELADVQTVLSGMAVSLKPLKELQVAFERVHESNMSKLGADGAPIYREDGKILKGPNYFSPDLSDLIS